MSIDKFPFITKPWDHQKEGVALSAPKNGFCYFYEVGTGKTKTTIDSMRLRYGVNGRLLKTLILGPPIIIQNWKNEILRHSRIQKTDIVPLVGDGKKRLATFKEHNAYNRIFITNYESLLMTDLFKEFYDYGFELIVADEVHFMKNSSSKRSKALYQLSDYAKYKYGLTGTPILNTPMDIYGIFRFVDKTIFGTNAFAFRNKYFYDKNANMPKHNHFPDWQPRSDMMADLAEKIASISHHVKKQECLDLPPLVRKRVEVELSSEQRKLYESMKKDLVAFVDGTTVTASVAQIALTKALRMQQIISGHLTVEQLSNAPGQNAKEIHVIKQNPRLDALSQILEATTPSSKVIVWAIFKQDFHEIRKVCERLDIKYCEVHGDVTQKTKDEAVRAFNNDDSMRVFIGHPRSGGIGINLIASNVTVYYSRSFNLSDDLQSEARNYRGGSEIHDKVTRIDIVASNTIDDVILKRLELKQEIGEKILVDLVKEL